MNKNIIKLFAIVMMIFMIGAVLVSCAGEKGEQGEQGLQGTPGVQGEKGEQGIAGLTPHIGPNGNWWIGDQDTGVCPEGKDLTDCENHQYVYRVWPGAEHTELSEGVELGVCTDCGDATWRIDPHVYDVVVEVVKPTCLFGGYTLYECKCGKDENVKRDLTEALGHVNGEKEYVKNEAGICACEWTNAWIINCSACGIQLDDGADGAKGHVWGEYNPMKPDAGTNPCTWIGGTVAECVNCKCEGHVDVKPGTTAKGHTWSQWTITGENNGEYTLVRTCSVCAASFAEGTQTKTISLADCGDAVVTDATCDENGSKVWYYTIDGQKLTVKTEVLPATGCSVSENSAYTVAADHSHITVKCDDCGKVLTMELPPLEIKKAYQIKNGDCDEPIDVYTILLTDKNNEIDGAVLVTFEVPAEYGHNNGLLGAGAKEIVIEINGTEYDAYWCETCQHWIAYQVHVA